MSENKPDREALDTARGLTDALEGMRTDLRSVKADAARSRHIIIGLIVSLVLDVTLTIVVAVFAVQAHHASVTVGQLHQTNVSACRLGNQSRAQQIALWEHLLSLAPPKTPKQRKLDAEFIAYIKKTFAPRNCTAIYRLP